MNVAQVSRCFRLTSQRECAHRTTEPNLSYLCTQGMEKKTSFFSLGSAVILDFSHFIRMLNSAVSIAVTASLVFQLHDRSQTHDTVTSNLHRVPASVPHRPFLSLSFHISS